MTTRLETLYKARPKNRLVRASVYTLSFLTLLTWSSGTIMPGDLFTSRRLENLERFLTKDIVPYPIRESGFEWGALWTWMSELFLDRGLDASIEP